MQSYFSWWAVDQERVALVSPATKQQIRYIGRVSDESELRIRSTYHRFWMRFDYEDAECKYPLLIERQNQPRSGRQRWRIDHIRSAELWRRETSSLSANPGYGLWRRVEDTITYGLTRWPAMDAIGPAPNGICVNGGWHNGVWTGQFYRWLSTFSSVNLAQSHSHLAPPPVPLSELPPASWELLSQSSTPENVVSSWLKGFGKRKASTESLEVMLARADFVGLPEPAFCGTHLRSRDDRCAIIPVGFLSRQSDARGRSVRLRLLYIDDDLICDCLSVECLRPRSSPDGSALWRTYFDSNVSHLQNGGILHRRDGLSAQLSSAPSGRIGLGPSVPRPALWNRLTNALLDGLPSWRSAYLALPQEYLKNMPSMEVPSCERVELLRASGMPKAFAEGFAVTKLKENVEKSPNIITFESAFEEADQQDGPAQAIETNIGWWNIDSVSRCIKNVTSGQCVTLENVSEIKDWGEAHWHFTYSDREIRYPIFVRRKFEKGDFGGIAAILEIDHTESAKLWRESTNRSEELPPYGLWRRVDDSVVDALCCWKELGGFTHNVRVHSIGGWFNGFWNGTWRRVFDAMNAGQAEASAAIAQAFLEPLNSAAPPPWRFVEHVNDVIRVDLTHVRQKLGRMPNLPPLAPLEGFQEQTSYLIRADNKAALFPAFASRRWENSSYPDFTNYYVGVGHFTYANEQMFLTCPFDAKRGSFFTSWQVELGVRTEIGAEPRNVEEDRPIANPAHYVTWRRLAFDILQAWPNWRGSGCRLLEDPVAFEAFKNSNDPNSGRMPKWEKSGIALETPRRVAIRGGFVGGIYTPNFVISSDGEEAR